MTEHDERCSRGNYGIVTRLEELNEPPVYVPPRDRVEAAPGVILVKLTMPPAEPPGGMLPKDCGNGVPLVVPSFAVVNMVLFAGKVPVFCIV